MASQTKKRRASVISISSGGPSPKRRGPVIYISSDDGSPPAKKRAVAPRPENGKVKVAASKQVGNHPSISSGYVNSEDLLAATKQLELLRSWVDAGIEIAIQEMASNHGYDSHFIRNSFC
jgi:hypothetical protein